MELKNIRPKKNEINSWNNVYNSCKFIFLEKNNDDKQKIKFNTAKYLWLIERKKN